MMYVVSIIKEQYGTEYRLFETNTETFFNCYEEELKKLMLENQLFVKNISIISGEIVENNWSHKIHRGGISKFNTSNYILVCQAGKDEFKLINNDKDVIWVNSEKLHKYTRQNKIYNCCIKDKVMSYIDVSSLDKDEQFEACIAEKYANYVAKTALLGRKMSFYYNIEGQEVRLVKYSGVTKDVIIPSFVTSISESAFYMCRIEAITLNDGLKYIGGYAFNGCKLEKVRIPKTVEFIGRGAFYGNKRLVKVGGEYTDKIELLRKDTIIIKDSYLGRSRA